MRRKQFEGHLVYCYYYATPDLKTELKSVPKEQVTTIIYVYKKLRSYK